jgi:hypothetical protein
VVFYGTTLTCEYQADLRVELNGVGDLLMRMSSVCHCAYYCSLLVLMDGSEDIMEHANLGRITNICSWSDLSEFDKDDAWLTEGWLKGPNSKDQKHVKTDTTSERGGWRLTNIWGFVEINGARFHARKLLIRRGDDVAKCRAIYAWAGE